MRNRILPALGMAAVLAGAFWACHRVPLAPAVPEATAPKAPKALPGPGAFDVVKMDRFDGRRGPVYFAHALHADLPGLDGDILPCSECHREVCGPPRRCGECHVGRRRGEPRGKLPST